ncbi:unnamed protein product [Citrullus colocynthis]|uniref:Uncharacterized protein n=1 Tax=Citrullus colocynthis TaxID=252529 RepID=A0ABP0Y4E5_9ROSI
MMVMFFICIAVVALLQFSKADMIADGKAEIDKKVEIAEIKAILKLLFNPKSSEEEAKLNNMASRIDNLKPQMKSCHDTCMKECMERASPTLCVLTTAVDIASKNLLADMIPDGKAEIDKKVEIAKIEAKLKLFFNPKPIKEEAKLKNMASRIDNLKPQMKSCHDTCMKECMGRASPTLYVLTNTVDIASKNLLVFS